MNKFFLDRGRHYHDLVLAPFSRFDHASHPNFLGESVLFSLFVLFKQFIDGPQTGNISAYRRWHIL